MSRAGLAVESDPDVVDQPDHGYAGVTGAGDGTADRGPAEARALRARPAATV